MRLLPQEELHLLQEVLPRREAGQVRMLSSTATGRPCFAKHIKGVPATRGAHIGIAKKGIAKKRPERQANGERVRSSPRAQQARTGPRAEGDAAGARRRLDPEAQ